MERRFRVGFSRRWRRFSMVTMKLDLGLFRQNLDRYATTLDGTSC